MKSMPSEKRGQYSIQYQRVYPVNKVYVRPGDEKPGRKFVWPNIGHKLGKTEKVEGLCTYILRLSTKIVAAPLFPLLAPMKRLMRTK